jgi:hypothetical protein
MERTDQMTLVDRLCRAGQGFCCGDQLTSYGGWWLSRAEEFGRALMGDTGPVSDGVWDLICQLAADEDVISVRVARWSDAAEDDRTKRNTMYTRVLLDNGGGITLQLNGWAHHYYGHGEPARCAADIAEWLRTGSTEEWEGHDPEALEEDPTYEEVRNGQYYVIYIDRADTLSSLADQMPEGWCNGRELADALRACAAAAV